MYRLMRFRRSSGDPDVSSPAAANTATSRSFGIANIHDFGISVIKIGTHNQIRAALACVRISFSQVGQVRCSGANITGRFRERTE